ncbi:hypothetical protein HDU76_012933 [Blyttiomyces sp. JEL0837]|nr:hypothetical protein HDU76_012933 [Blyttiomyces sp. JEL0837]
MTPHKSILSVLLLLALLFNFALAWEKEDFAIFDLHDSLAKIKGEKDENGNKVDFYTVLEVSPKATSSEINKAYRKLSLALHPDKNPSKEAADLYALLTSINAILKDQGSRERYDRHRARGIPKWRGTGYFIARYKPGVPFIVTFCIGAISVAQYAALYIIYLQKKSRLDTVRRERMGHPPTADDLTYNQLRKILKRIGVSEPASMKKAIKAGMPTAEILKLPELAGLNLLDPTGAAGGVGNEEDDEEIQYLIEQVEINRPTVTGTLVAQIPIQIYKAVVGVPSMLLGSGGKGKKGKKGKGDEKFIGDDDDEFEGEEEDEEEEGEEGVSGVVNGTGGDKKASAATKKANLSEKFKEQRQRKGAKKAASGKKEKGGEEGEGEEKEEEEVKKVVKKKLPPGMIKSSTGVVMSKAEFLKMRQAAMKNE